MDATTLRMTLPGEQDAVDAENAFKIFAQVMKLAGQLDARAGAPRGGWTITDLRLGSVKVAVRPQDMASADALAALLDGYGLAEQRKPLPKAWSTEIVTAAADLARQVGGGQLLLELLADSQPARSVTVTRSSEEYLRSLARERRASIGSVIGKLDSISVHENRRAGLWPLQGGRQVVVSFKAADQEIISAALGKVVEISGVLERDVNDRPIGIRMRGLEVINQTARPLTDLIGMDPDFTDGMSAEEYVKEIRGAA